MFELTVEFWRMVALACITAWIVLMCIPSTPEK